MRRLLTFFFALALVLGTGGVELREGARPEPCGCCETMVPGEPCGCGMPQSPSPQRCGGNASWTAVPTRPTAAPQVRLTPQARPAEAHPCPNPLAVYPIRNGEDSSLPAAAFAPGVGPPRMQGARLSWLGLYRI